mgnify:CR=1 FL=1
MVRQMKFLDKVSHFLNATVFRGNINETISGRSHPEKLKAEEWIDNVLGKDHCKESHINDEKDASDFVELSMNK